MAGSAMPLAMAFGGSAQAFEFTVDNTADGSEGSLRDAVIQANDNPGPDTIVFGSLFDSPQTINLSSGSLFIDDKVTIEGPGSELLTIDGAEQTDRIFLIDGAEDLGISSMTLTGGRTPDGDPIGGGIFSEDSDLTLTDTVITGNIADDMPADGAEGSGFGGGVALIDGSLTVSDSVISGNSAGQDGDGVTNSVSIGGGILAIEAEVLIENSTISENKAINRGGFFLPAGGGGVSLFDGGNLTIQRSTISGNIAGNTADNGSEDAYGLGGGVSFVSYYGQLLIVESTISGNVAGNTGTADDSFGSGGGVFSYGDTVVVNSTIAGNIAGSVDNTGSYARGGELFARDELTVLSSTIVDNHAIGHGAEGGGIANLGEETAELHNTIVADNTADGGPDLFSSPLGEFNAGYSLVENQNGATISVIPPGTVLSGPAGLSPLADNGGPTQTHALDAGDPVFNTGDPGDCLATDQRGITRPQLGGCDIGAFEFQLPLEGLLEFFDNAVDEGDLEGKGPGKSARNRLRTFRHWLANALAQFEGGDVDGACNSLQSALNRTDGVAPPPDFVQGDAADDMAAAIAGARTAIGCE